MNADTEMNANSLKIYVRVYSYYGPARTTTHIAAVRHAGHRARTFGIVDIPSETRTDAVPSAAHNQHIITTLADWHE